MLPRTEVDYKPIPPISPEDARAAALSMADTAIRLDAADCVRAVGRFDDGAAVYAARLPEALVRQTRAEAEADWFKAMAARGVR